jgi:hypothetical protein
MEKRNKQEGVLLDLEPGESVEVFKQLLKPGNTASGLCELQTLTGKVICTLLAGNKDLGGESNFFMHKRLPNMFRGGVFKTTMVEDTVSFNTSQSEKLFRLGGNPKVIDEVSGDFLKGNYGLMYKITVYLDNRQNKKSRLLDLVMIPAGGMVRGNMQINDMLYETKLLQSKKDEGLIKRIELFPNEFRRMTIETMPQPGSYYPVNLLIREVNK